MSRPSLNVYGVDPASLNLEEARRIRDLFGLARIQAYACAATAMWLPPSDTLCITRERFTGDLGSLPWNTALLLTQGEQSAHPDDEAVDRFAAALKQKLAQARAKGRGGWQDKDECPQQRLSEMLRDHVEKGDPRDVANFCMFLHQRGEGILPSEQPAHGALARALRRAAGAVCDFDWSDNDDDAVEAIERLRTALAAGPAAVPEGDHDEMVRRLDVALNGDGAAPQASLCDIVGQVENVARKRGAPLLVEHGSSEDCISAVLKARALFTDGLINEREAAPYFADWLRQQAALSEQEFPEAAVQFNATAEVIERLAYRQHSSARIPENMVLVRAAQPARNGDVS